jgi:hypothetical protein
MLEVAAFFPSYCHEIYSRWYKYPNAISDRLQVSFSLTRSQSIIAHLAFDDLGLPAMVARHHAFFEDLIKYGIMKDGFLPRANSAEGRAVCAISPARHAEKRADRDLRRFAGPPYDQRLTEKLSDFRGL